MYPFSYLEPVCCSMSSSNCCFLTCIEVSQEAHQVVWYSHLFQNFPQFIVIHTIKGFGIVYKAEIDVFLELSCFFSMIQRMSHMIDSCSLESSWEWSNKELSTSSSRNKSSDATNNNDAMLNLASLLAGVQALDP